MQPNTKIVNSLKPFFFPHQFLLVFVYLMCGPRQVFFHCGPKTPKGWTPLLEITLELEKAGEGLSTFKLTYSGKIKMDVFRWEVIPSVRTDIFLFWFSVCPPPVFPWESASPWPLTGGWPDHRLLDSPVSEVEDAESCRLELWASNLLVPAASSVQVWIVQLNWQFPAWLLLK